MKPKILLATTARWFSPARLAIALARAGCEIEAICPPGNVLEKTSVARCTYHYRALGPVNSFYRAIAASKPDLIIPGEDLATLHLHEIHYREQIRGSEGARIASLIERSLGAPTSFSLVYARTALMEMAQKQGVLAPATEVVRSITDVRQAMARMGHPLVLKTDASSGGFGVRIVQSPHEAEVALARLGAPPALAPVLKWAIADCDYNLVLPFLLRKKRVVNAQQFIAGPEATSAVACWKGKVLASVHFRVICKQDRLGPSTVLALTKHPDMTFAEVTLVRQLNLSGLYGFDYILDEKSGRAYLIEINPRATQVCHLAMGPGQDLAEAIYAALTANSIRETPTITEKDTVALFPQEWKRDATSRYLSTAYHDVPWQEPRLVRACIETVPRSTVRIVGRKWPQSVLRKRAKSQE